jgi:DNA-3-methyladenine glycosylase I
VRGLECKLWGRSKIVARGVILCLILHCMVGFTLFKLSRTFIVKYPVIMSKPVIRRTRAAVSSAAIPEEVAASKSTKRASRAASVEVAESVEPAITQPKKRSKASSAKEVDVAADAANASKAPPADSLIRCGWVGHGKPYYEAYHDNEWGNPVHDDRIHFEFLILEGAQAGLSWDIILKKREGYRAAFKNFDPVLVAKMTDKELEELQTNTNIIRNKAKIAAARTNANVFLSIQKEFGTFDKYIWGFVNNKPIMNHWKTLAEVPATTAESDALSKDLKTRGMKFVGSTIIYSHMQAVGLVNDHLVSCFRRTKA